jgi:prepilin-type N-terminal cleavage/methylation domain-containing protein
LHYFFKALNLKKRKNVSYNFFVQRIATDIAVRLVMWCFFSKSDQGFSLIEAMVGISLLGLAASGTMFALNNFFQSNTQTTDKVRQSKVLNQLVQSIQNNPKKFKINYNIVDPSSPSFSSQINQVLNPSSLPLAYSESTITTVQQCPTCTGQFGFVIQPMVSLRGLYWVFLRIKTSSSVSDFQFIAADQ